MNFGDFIRNRRIELGFKLREFCLTFGYDPSNWSKIERGILPPSDDTHSIEILAEQLNIQIGTAEWFMFSDLAFQNRGKIPPDILNDEEKSKTLPLFFKSLRGYKTSEEEINLLMGIFKNNK